MYYSSLRTCHQIHLSYNEAQDQTTCFLFPQQSSLVCYYSCLCYIDLVEEFHQVEEIYSFEKVGVDPVLYDLGALDLQKSHTKAITAYGLAKLRQNFTSVD